MKLGTNLSGVVDWSTQLPFLDMIKMSRPWYAFGEGQFNNYEYLHGNGHLDAAGWPASIPHAGNIQTIFDLKPGHYLTGRNHTLRWQGNGAIVITGASNVVTGPNRISFDWGTGALGIIITATATAPNNIRAMTLVRTDRMALLDGGGLFNPEFLGFVRGMGHLRFMDWQCTNNSDQTDWIDRPLGSKVTYAEDVNGFAPMMRGVPLGVCVALCNRLRIPGWFNIPHRATDAYVASMAAFIRDNLSPDLFAYFEYSNEVWNNMFAQTAYAAQQGGAGFQNSLKWYGKRSGECFAIIDTVFAKTPARARKVLATQSSAWAVEQVLTPGADHIAVTSYFGYGLQLDTARVAAIDRAYPVTSDAVIQGYLTDPAHDWSLPAWRENMLAISATAKAHGLTMLLYEGGCHAQMNNTAGTATTQAAVLKHHLSGLQAGNYEYLWNVWQSEVEAGGAFSVYADIGAWGVNGNWTLAQTYGQPLFPAAARLITLSRLSPADAVLRGAMGIFETVKLVGYDKAGNQVMRETRP